MTRITFYIGLGHEFRPNDIDKAQAYLATTFGGYTWYSGSGGWTGPSGLETEPSATVTVFSTLPVTAQAFDNAAQYLRVIFAQAEVWYVVEAVPVRIASASGVNVA